MAETANQPRHRRLTLALVAAAVVVVVAAAMYLANRGERANTRAAPPPSTSQAAPPAATPTTSTPSTPAPSPTSTVRHDVVPAAAPTSFVYRGHGVTVRADVCGMPYVRPLDPPGEQHHTVCWVQHDFGFAPGTDGHGTTYVLGHSWGQDPHEVLNAVSERAMAQVLASRSHSTRKLDGITVHPVTRLNGDVIILRTPNGTLRYTVRDAYTVSKAQAGNIRALMAEHTRNRVVLITCGERNHVDYDVNVIVEAYLSSSTASSSTA